MSGSMLGLISQGPQDDQETQARRAELAPASTGEVLGAAMGEGFSESVGPRLGRTYARGYIDQGDGTYAPLNATDELGLPTGLLPPSPMVPLEQLKREYEIPGVLSFDKDTPQSVAQSLYDHKRDQMARQDSIRRADNMLTSGAAARFGASMIGSLADPVNLAAMFVPGMGEANVARMFGVEAGASALARAGVRAGAGATQGAAGMAALEPLNYMLSRQERDDWTMAGALANVLFGTIAGAGLHSGLGALAERSRGLPDWAPARVNSDRIQGAPPEVQEALARASIAAQVEGRPFDVAPLLDLADGLEATSQLRRLADAQRRYEGEAQTAMEGVQTLRERAARPNTRAEAADQFGSTAERMRAEAESLRSDIARVRERAVVSAMDPETSGRLEAIDAEMAGTIPAARRRALVAERQMLMEGRRPGIDQADDLTTGRDVAELRGLTAALERATAGADKAEAAMALARREADVADAQRSALAQQASTGERVALSRLAAREAVVDDNAARAVRQIAGAMDTRLSQQEARELGRALTRGHIGLEDALLAIERWKADKARITPESLGAEMSNNDLLAIAEREIASLEKGTRQSFDAATTRTTSPADAEPPAPGRQTPLPPPEPKPPGEPSATAKDIAEIEKQVGALDAQIRQRADEPMATRIKEFDALADEEARIDKSLFETAAACIVRTR